MRPCATRPWRWLLLAAAAVALALAALFAATRNAAAPVSAADEAALDAIDPPNSIAIVFVRADSPLDWSSPAGVTRTALDNYLSFAAPDFPHPIGHAFAHIRCSGPAKERNVWAGVTGGGTKTDLRRLVFSGEGLGILTGTFTGRMMPLDDVLSERRFHRTSGRAERIRFLVSEAACARALAFHDEFVHAKIYRAFGLTKRPRWREGAGCTTFVLSLLDVAGIKPPAAAWSTTVRIPQALIGSPERDIGVAELLYTSRAQHWAAPGEPAIAMTFPDVSKAEAWLRRLRTAADTATTSAAFSLPTRFDAEGLIVDARSIAVPAEPVFYR